jgi:hypothetical protein
MQGIEAAQIRDLLVTQEFQDWYARYEQWHADREQLRRSYDDRVMHAILLAGDYEDLSAQAQAEFGEIDNNFEMLSEFEAQRSRTSAAWIEQSSAEAILEEHRQTASELQRKLDAARKQSGGAPDGVLEKRLESELRAANGRVEEANERVAGASERLTAETRRRAELWAQVEHAWSAAFRSAMARAEYALQARRLRGFSETVGPDDSCAERGARASAQGAAGTDSAGGGPVAAGEKAMRKRLQRLAQEAAEAFGCVLIEEFLYWPPIGDSNRALCVPLVGDDKHLNVQVAPLRLYEVKRVTGVDFVEPVPDVLDTGDDHRRLHDFFFAGRPQTAG